MWHFTSNSWKGTVSRLRLPHCIVNACPVGSHELFHYGQREDNKVILSLLTHIKKIPLRVMHFLTSPCIIPSLKKVITVHYSWHTMLYKFEVHNIEI